MLRGSERNAAVDVVCCAGLPPTLAFARVLPLRRLVYLRTHSTQTTLKGSSAASSAVSSEETRTEEEEERCASVRVETVCVIAEEAREKEEEEELSAEGA